MKKNYKLMAIICTISILINLFALSAFATVGAADETVSDTFVTYSFSTENVEYVTYSTTSSNNPENSSLASIQIGSAGDASIASVIGSDGRTKVTDYSSAPYSAICYIVTHWSNGGSTSGTGWLFNEDSIMTAGHCVYNSTYGGAATGMTVYPAKYGTSNPYGAIKATGFTINSNWEEYETLPYDYALVKLSTDVGSQCGYFGYTYNGGSIGDNITVTGYPGDKFDVESEIAQWTMSGRLNAIALNRLSYTIDTYGGQSGSPVYLTDSYIAIGVHTTGGLLDNSATRINYNMYQMMIEY